MNYMYVRNLKIDFILAKSMVLMPHFRRVTVVL